MARALITLTWCDVHLTSKDEEVPAEHFTWDDMEVDLCTDCAPTVLAARALFEEYGSKGPRTMAPPAPKDPGPRGGSYTLKGQHLPCPAEGCPAVLGSKASLGSHCRQQHGKTLGELEGRPLPHHCPECGQGFTGQQGLTLHLAAHARQRESSAAAPAAPKKAQARKRSQSQPAPTAD